MGKYNIGISSFTYNFAVGHFKNQMPKIPWTPMDLVNKAVEIGADLVQFGDNMPLEDYDEEYLKNVGIFAKENGLILEAGMRKGTVERIRKYIRITEIIGASFLRVIMEGRDGYEPKVDEVCEIIKEVLPELNSKGITIGIENYDKMNTSDYAKICEMINDPLVGLTVDTTNSLSREEPVDQVIDNMAPYCVCLHVKDYDIVRNNGGIGLKIIGACPGEGRQNIKKCFDKCKNESGRDFNLVLESWMEPQESLEASLKMEDDWAKRGIENLRKIIG